MNSTIGVINRLFALKLLVLVLMVAGCSSGDEQGVLADGATSAEDGSDDAGADGSTTAQETITTLDDTVSTTSITTTTSSTTATATSSSAAPPSLPDQTFKVTVSGPNAGVTIQNAVRSQPCSGSCTIELFDWASGPTTVEWETNASSSIDLEDDSGCLSGNQVVAFSSLSVGQTCTITLRAEGDSEYEQTAVRVGFKATPAVVFTWDVNNFSKQPSEPLEAGESITFSVAVTRQGTNVGNLALFSQNMTVSGDNFYLPVGTHNLTATAGNCGQTAELQFGVDMAGTVFGDGNGPSSFVWQVVCP